MAVWLTAESAESTFSLLMQMYESVEQHDENIWQIHLLRTVFAGGVRQAEGWPRTVGLRSSLKGSTLLFCMIIIIIIHVCHGCMEQSLLLLAGSRQRSKVTSWFGGYFIG